MANHIIPEKRYSKRDMCYLLMDPNVNLDNPGEAKRISVNTLCRWIKGKPGMLKQLNVTEKQFNNLKTFSVTQAGKIIDAFL